MAVLRLPVLTVRLRGDLEVLHGAAPRPLPPSRRARALLAYLVAVLRPHLREQLCDLLWDAPSDPRGELRWCLSKLRPLLDVGTARLVADREHVAFDASGAAVDLHAVRAAIGSNPCSAATDVLLDAPDRDRASHSATALRMQREA